LLLQHAQQQFSPVATVTFFISTLAVFDSLSFIGQESPQQEQQLAEAFAPDDFIGQESPLQQQSSLSQHEVFVSPSAACAFIPFIAHESAAVLLEPFD